MNSYSRSNRKSGGHPTGTPQSAEPDQPDLREASLLWLAKTFGQLRQQALAIATGLSAHLDRYGPVWFDRIATRSRQVLASLRAIYNDHHALARYVAHLVVLVMVLGTLPISQIKLSHAVEAAPPQARDALEQGRLFLAAWTQPSASDQGYLLYAMVPHTTLAEPAIPGLGGEIIDPSLDFPRGNPDVPRSDVVRPRDSVITYTVQPGDTVLDIADRFDLSPDTVLWANGSLEDRPDKLAIGQELLILPVSGVYHTVAKGETLESIAKKYKVEPAAIIALSLNNVQTSADLQVGQKLIVPGGQQPGAAQPVLAQAPTPRSATASGLKVTSSYDAAVPADAAKGVGSFAWPVTGIITQRFSRGHPGIDIATAMGTPIYAADAGYVVYAGWSTVGYGNMVLIDHGNGNRTLYGHMSRILVQAGQSVAKGDIIGRIGCTGRCSGPHLHLEIIENGVKLNPLGLLGR